MLAMRKTLCACAMGLFVALVPAWSDVACGAESVVLRVGVPQFPPLAFMEQGEARGFFIELLEAAASREGWTLYFKEGNLGELLGELEAGALDVLPCLSRNPARLEKLDFNDESPYLDWGVVYRRKGAAINTLFDLQGKRVAMLRGSAYNPLFENLMQQFEVNVSKVICSSYEETLSALDKGEADAAITGNLVGAALDRNYGVERTTIVFAPLKLYFAVPKGTNADVLRALDHRIADLKADRSSLFYQRYDYWHGMAGKDRIPDWLVGGMLGLVALTACFGVFIFLLRTMVGQRTRELKSANESLRSSEQRFRILFEQHSAAMTLIDPLTGAILDANDAACRYFGYTRNELTALRTSDINILSDAERRENRLDAMSGKREHFRFRNRLASGEIREVEVYVSPVQFPGQVLLFAIIHDINDRALAEKRLSESEERLRSVIDSTPLQLYFHKLDDSGRLLFTGANPAGAAALKRPLESLVGVASCEAFPGLRSSNLHDIFRKVATGEMPNQSFQTVFDRGLGPTLYETHVFRTGPGNIAVYAIDVTEREKMREMMVQSEKMLSVGGLAAGMAHEINNPLGGIIQSAQVVLNRLLKDQPASIQAARDLGCELDTIRQFLRRREILELITSMDESARRAAKIVANMLAFSRKSESTHAPASVSEMLDKAVELASADYDLRKHYDFRKIVIARDYDPDLPEVPCSVTKVEQVFLNIVRNAAQAMGHGQEGRTPRILLRTRRSGDMARIEIEDNGPGMDEQTRRRIFEPFFTTKSQGEGTGLGLSVSYFLITEGHGGSIHVESQPGKGARFVIHLPLQKPAS